MQTVWHSEEAFVHREQLRSQMPPSHPIEQHEVPSRRRPSEKSPYTQETKLDQLENSEIFDNISI